MIVEAERTKSFVLYRRRGGQKINHQTNSFEFDSLRFQVRYFNEFAENIHITQALHSMGYIIYSSETSTFYHNDLAMRNNADVTGQLIVV
jgi:hypothetical protein